jgi:dienelactone hydrolase
MSDPAFMSSKFEVETNERHLVPVAFAAHVRIMASRFADMAGARLLEIAVGTSAAVICLGILAGAGSTMAETVTKNIDGRRQALEPYFHTYRPDGSGPFPALLFVSGCVGFAYPDYARSFTDMAEGWRARGYVVAFVDWLQARGEEHCFGETASEIAKDVLATARYFQSQPFISSSDVTAIGWSMGASALLKILEETGPDEPSPLRSVIAYTPGCGNLEPWDSRIPALVFLGATDKIYPAEACQHVFARLRPGTPLVARVYPDAGHTFNLPRAIGYNADATAAATREIDQFMK